jgi:TRAP-type C4-dicarboxylate transport system permease small subunit
MASLLDKLSRRINDGVERLLFLLGFSMALVVAAQVFSRYALNHSFFWSEELARFLLVWLTFLGASAAYRRRVHAGIDVVYKRFPAWGRKASRLTVHLGALTFAGIMIWYGTAFAWFVRLQISPALLLPKWIPHSIIPIAGAVLFIHALAFLAAEVLGNEEKP